MKRYRKMLALLLSFGLTAGILSGCSDSSKKNSEEPAAAKGSTSEENESADNASEDDASEEVDGGLNYDGVTLSIVMAKGWDTKGREDLLKKYTEKTGVEFDVQMLPDDMAGELVKTKFATNELPDIIMNSGSVREHTYMLPEEKLVDLTEEAWVDQLINKESLMVDGKIWGMPLGGQGYFAFAINKKVFEENGLEIPKSKAELEECFEVLKNNGIQPMYLGSKDPWLVGNMTSGAIQKALEADPDVIEKLNTNQMKYADLQGFIDVLADLRKWNEKGWLGENTMADSWDGHYQAFAEGKCGVTIGLTTWDVTLEEKFPGMKDNVEMIPFFIGDSDTFFAGTTAQWYIPKSGENIDIVKDFFRFAAEQENLNAFYQAMGEASTPWKDVEVDCLPPTKQLLDKINSGEYSYHYGHNNLVQGQDFDGLSKVAQEVLIGTMTPKEGAESYDNMRAQIAKALGLQGF